MQYIDFDQLEAINAEDYRARKPFPWINPEGLLTPSGYRDLVATLPDMALFDSSFGLARKNQQAAHDRYILEYRDDLSLSDPWRSFIDELSGARYKDNLCRLLGVSSVALNFHWHYTPNGCTVSPHADSTRKAGSHIFYFNTAADWNEAWGGNTLLLDDGGRLNFRSSPSFADFDSEITATGVGNCSLLFSRTDHAWHGVKAIDCPPDNLRKVFIVVINHDRIRDKLRRFRRRSNLQYF